jgi:hypothetical protein
VIVSLQTRIADLITAVGTDIKQLRTWLTGSSSGDLTGLATTDKTNVVAAINEVSAAAASATVPDADTTTKGKIEIATLAEVATGTDSARAVTPAGVRQERTAIEAQLPAAASTTVQGKIEIATLAEVSTGTDTVRAVTPEGVRQERAAVEAQLPASSSTTVQGKIEIATLAEVSTGTDTVRAVTPQGVKQETDAVRTYADGLLDANNAYQYKGVIDCSANPNYPAASAGHTYKVSVAGKIGGASGTVVEVGDTITCLVDGTAAGTQAAVGANWIVMQTNIDGAVTGPASSTAGAIATFSGTTGKVIQTSAVTISTDGTMASNSDSKVPTEKAVLTYLAATYYTQTQLGNYDTDLAALYATAKA